MVSKILTRGILSITDLPKNDINNVVPLVYIRLFSLASDVKTIAVGRCKEFPTNLARAYSVAVDAGGVFGHLFSRLSFLFSFSLALGDGPI